VVTTAIHFPSRGVGGRGHEPGNNYENILDSENLQEMQHPRSCRRLPIIITVLKKLKIYCQIIFFWWKKIAGNLILKRNNKM
jgi:hypothetical protein